MGMHANEAAVCDQAELLDGVPVSAEADGHAPHADSPGEQVGNFVVLSGLHKRPKCVVTVYTHHIVAGFQPFRHIHTKMPALAGCKIENARTFQQLYTMPLDRADFSPPCRCGANLLGFGLVRIHLQLHTAVSRRSRSCREVLFIWLILSATPLQVTPQYQRMALAETGSSASAAWMPSSRLPLVRHQTGCQCQMALMLTSLHLPAVSIHMLFAAFPCRHRQSAILRALTHFKTGGLQNSIHAEHAGHVCYHAAGLFGMGQAMLAHAVCARTPLAVPLA